MRTIKTRLMVSPSIKSGAVNGRASGLFLSLDPTTLPTLAMFRKVDAEPLGPEACRLSHIPER